VFAFIPFVDELLPEIAGLEAVMAIVDLVGNLALAIVDIVAHPTSAPMDIMGLLTLGGTKYEDDFASMASKRRAIGGNDLAKIGSDFKLADDKLQKVIKKDCKL
jgi:glucan 1,3-beta-glucosidase